MRYIKKFESFTMDTKVAPARPKTDPGTKPKFPSPVRRTNPGTEPRPKATVDDVINLFDYVSSEQDKKEMNEYYAKKDNK